MGRAALWREISGRLAAEIARGHVPPGGRLPTEAKLAARFGVNRHTIRQALSDLAARGLVHARRGAGVFVVGRPSDLQAGRRSRVLQAATAPGAFRRLTRIETRAADRHEAEALALAPGAAVHVVEGISLSDGVPLAAFRSVFPAARLPDLPEALARTETIPAALAACGVAASTRGAIRLTAKAAKPVQALQLQLPEGAPLLRSVTVTLDAEGRPLDYATIWFAGERVTLTLGDEP